MFSPAQRKRFAGRLDQLPSKRGNA